MSRQEMLDLLGLKVMFNPIFTINQKMITVRFAVYETQDHCLVGPPDIFPELERPTLMILLFTPPQQRASAA